MFLAFIQGIYYNCYRIYESKNTGETSMINQKEVELKKDGLAGLFYNRNSAGELVNAEDAKKGEKYTCPVCGCRMHPTTTPTGKKIFARNPGEVHGNPICATIDKKRIKHSFAGLSPDDFISSLCYKSPRRKAPGGDGPVSPGPNGGGGGNTIEIKNMPFSSLKQIAESGIDHLNPDDRQGEYKISDFIITYRFGGRFFKNPLFSLGARIVYARYIGFDSNSQSIIFAMYGQQENYSVRFKLLFPKKNDFLKYRDQFGHFSENSVGKTVFTKNHDEQDVLIACDSWNNIGKDRCSKYCRFSEKYCKNCCGMYQAVFTSKDQMHLITSDH